MIIFLGMWAFSHYLLNISCEESNTTEWLHFHFSLSCIGEGNGNPLQCSYLENPRDRGAWWAAVHGVAESDTSEWLHFYFSLSCIGEGNGNPLQCSYLENPRDRGAWWAAISGVAQSWTQLKWLSSSSSSLHLGNSFNKIKWRKIIHRIIFIF